MLSLLLLRALISVSLLRNLIRHLPIEVFSIILKLKSHYIILSVSLSQDARYVEYIIMTKLSDLAILSYAVFKLWGACL